MCISIKHRRCEKVQAAGNIVLFCCSRYKKKGLKDVYDDVDTVLKDRKDNLTKLENEYETELKTVDKTFQILRDGGTVAVPKDNCSPEEWVKLIPFNFLISGLLENKKISRLEKPCMLCERSNSKSVDKATVVCLQCADTLCETCAKYHNLMKFTSDHVIKPLDEYLSDGKNNLSVFKNTCYEHPNKIIELYCADHECPCCSMCISIKHRRCEKVQSIDEAAEGILSSAIVQDVRQGLKYVHDDMKTVLQDRKDNLTKIENKYTSKTFQREKDIIETEIVKYENNQKVIENERKLLEICVTEASNVQLLMEIQKLKTKLDEHKNILRDRQDLQTNTLSLQNVEYQSIITQIENLCKVNCEITPNNLSMRTIPMNFSKFNRFSSLGTNKLMSGLLNLPKQMQFPFLVSKTVLCYGFLTYGCKQLTNHCTIQTTIRHGSEILGEIKTTLHDKKFENNITEILLPKPLTLLPNERYDIVFILNSQSLCNSGEKGKPELECEDVVFCFKRSEFSKNGTNETRGQIPGILFSKTRQYIY
ncbi:unnamed protein product [Mytilus coruscus]|uniref:B box-type domain-containing protein n=1 Tax=Mytilus coruscus TaxID=42192 RepID=A0A6J8BQA1_MYTCO|nr:unnamed protein product [Mytilus coruscus]